MSKRIRTRRPLSSKGNQSPAAYRNGGAPETTDIFQDRRQEADRRSQSLPIPLRMCRRREERRRNTFNSRPWWLQVNYNDDYNSWI
jgi:hypothetical protein